MLYLLPFLSVVAGYLIALLLKPDNPLGLKLLLAFSGAYLLSITVFEFLPDVYSTGNSDIGIFIMGGILLQILLEFLSRGAEHGHLHHDENSTKFPWLLLISLCLHSLLEGFPLVNRAHLLQGVVLHNIPIAIILSTFFLKSNISRGKGIFFILVFASMTPIGSWLSSTYTGFGKYEVFINSIVIGIFLHISTTILFEASSNHKFNAGKMATILAGILLAYLF